MGLRDRIRGNDGDDGPPKTRFQMREKLLSIGDDYWIEDADGRRAYKVDGKAVRIRDTFVLRDADGGEAAKIQERKLSVRDAMEIELDGRSAKVKKAVVGPRERFHVDVDGGDDMNVQGNNVDHQYSIERDGDPLATLTKRRLRVRDTYGVEIEPGADEALVLAITVCIDDMSRG
jgi:uncharacterized protein YxjI